jgi:hypothetical protein
LALAHSPSIVTSGLVLCLDAANTKSYPGSGTTWTNLLGTGNNGTLVNGPTYGNANGGYINFDGTNDYASSTISLPSSSMTVEITFRINATGSFVDIAVLDDGTNELLIELGGNNAVPNTNGYLRYYSSYTGGAIGDVSNSLASSSQYILDSKIHTSVLTVGSSLATSYFDGVFQGSGSVTETKTFTRLVLANDLLRSSRACNCRIYQVKIYNRALTASEVQQNYNALKGRFGLT